ncbi:hypothetical protein C5Y96_04920 [Blastopirellula marina]|uniref:Uncharacterized protein n=1 Tax=Blastopirellula marina TaxID=124 RepID=A0A2S8G424_9BACT|nr:MULTISPECIES: hypothetical protein [Pirellulaceae]PQO39202.1 hypothetical protein C5Y96_04920 [Blastopirellula marina]RCS55510.1 hypothetical protein DTL36_04930 [Bremerella cremea]
MDRQSPSISPELRGICLSLATGGTALLATAAVIACGLRLSISEFAPISAGTSLAITLLAAAWCASIRAAWLAASPKELSGRLHGVIAIAPFVSAILIARAVTFAPPTEFATFLLWFAILTQEGLTLSLFVTTIFGDRIDQLLSRLETKPAAPLLTPALKIELEESPSIADEPIEEESFDLPPGVTQQLTRATEAGQEQIHGLVRAKFVSGQRHVYLHVGFCPPLPSIPHVELHQLEGPDVQIKPGQILTNGVRFDLKLREAPTVDALPVFEFLATCPSMDSEGLREAC